MQLQLAFDLIFSRFRASPVYVLIQNMIGLLCPILYLNESIHQYTTLNFFPNNN